MVQDWPKISIVTPSFNQSSYLEACIRSVLEQGYPNLEYIVMDGGSTDGSIEILQQYSLHLSYWQSQPDSGQADAIAKGFDRATGEIFAWLNSDDLLCQGALFEVAAAYQQDPSVGLIYGNSFLINQSGQMLRALIASSMDYTGWIYNVCSVFQGSVFFTRKAYHQVLGIDTRLLFAMEYKLFYSIAKRYNTMHITKFLACLRIHPLTKSSTISHVGTQELRKILLDLENVDNLSFTYKLHRFFLISKRRLVSLTDLYIFNERRYQTTFFNLVK